MADCGCLQKIDTPSGSQHLNSSQDGGELLLTHGANGSDIGRSVSSKIVPKLSERTFGGGGA